MEAHRGTAVDRFFDDINSVLNEDWQMWESLLPESERTAGNAALAFTIHARAAGGVKYHIRANHSGYPFKLFSMFDDQKNFDQTIDELENDRKCMWCEFTKRFMGTYGSKLRSPEAQAFLHMLALLARNETVRLECRMNVIKKLLEKRKGKTWHADVQQASSDFVLLRQRIMEQGPCRSQYEQKDSIEEVPKTTPGGGAWRSFISETMTGRTFKNKAERSDAFTKAAEDFKALLDDEQAKHKALGKLGTEAHREGGSAFGALPPRDRVALGPLED